MKQFFEEFKAFATKGNVVDMAVGVIIGGAFGKIVSSLVSDIIMPLIGIILGGINFTNLSITLGSAVIKYGNFLQMVIDFLIIAFSIFVVIKIANALKRKKEIEEKVEEVKKDEQIILLEEIRDLLKK